MTSKEFADILLPGVKHTWEEYEKMYPERDLPEGAIVTRYAPSPTGLPHMGNLFQAFISKVFSSQTKGVFFLRIEDTDTERSIEDGVKKIIEAVKPFDMKFDEGAISDTEEVGNYGPYFQSQRKDIYQAYAKKLIEEGKAYASFASKEELDEIRREQEISKQRLGYYGRWAKDRFLSMEDTVKRIENGDPYIIRLKSPGDFYKKVVLNDAIKGKIELPENDIDEVIIKSDGLPTYHFAHVIDDHLMHTTHIIRGDEYVSSTNKHLQMFEMLGFKAPIYCHIAPLNKNDEGTIRKLSKRKDPEARLMYYIEEGIPTDAVMLYLATITNSNFEAWLDANPTGKIEDFKFDFKKANSTNGTLFDLPKLLNISKNYLSRLSKEEIYNKLLEYTKEYDKDFYEIITKYPEYTKEILNIEREQKKPRKDYAKYSDVKNGIWYMYDELFTSKDYEWQKVTDKNEIKEILNTYIDEYYDENDDKDTWFSKMQDLSNKLGYAGNMKDYKENPDNYKGNVADVSTVIRVGLTTKSQTPDLYELLRLLGKDKIKERFNQID
ncbi:MAG: glutamate--tRNA ligase [Bacilli bacterium]|nr:glutamate--tRNA ligase [Bacilli bacterium]MBO6195507.1 glutamate--tRNA ligase [Bacilli bacterium]